MTKVSFDIDDDAADALVIELLMDAYKHNYWCYKKDLDRGMYYPQDVADYQDCQKSLEKVIGYYSNGYDYLKKLGDIREKIDYNNYLLKGMSEAGQNG